MTRATILNEDDVNEIKRLYVSGEIKSKDKIAKKFNIDRRRVNRIFDEFQIESACSGYIKTFTDEQRDEIIRLYVEEKLRKDDIGKIFKTSKHSIARLLEENNIKTLNNWERVKVVSVIDGEKYIETDEYTFIAKHKETNKIFNDYKNISGSLIRYISEINPEIEIPSKHNRGVYYKKTGNYWYEQYFDIIKISKIKNIEHNNLIPKTVQNIKNEDRVFIEHIITNNEKIETPETYVELKKKRGELFDEDIKNIVEGYTTGRIRNIDELCKEFKISKIKAKNILIYNGVELNKTGGQKKLVRKKHKDKPKIPVKYIQKDGVIYRAIDKETGEMIEDFNNVSGGITKYLKEKYPNIKIFELDSEKYKYFIKTGDYWYEQYVKIKKFTPDELNFKKCPYCNEYLDMNESYRKYKFHLIKKHNIDITKYVDIYPEDLYIFKNGVDEIKWNEDKNNWVICKICGEKMGSINHSHLKRHNITTKEYKEKYGETMSLNFKNDLVDRMSSYNLKGITRSYVSKPERGLQEFLNSLNVKHENNRSMLIGKEIDLLIEDKKIGIEFNGNKWHTEWFGGKDKNYHLNKTLLCNDKGYGLIHIFEDEYFYKNEIVLNKIKHILGENNDLPKIGARKCVIKHITNDDRDDFLEKYHIQGKCKSNINLGAFYDDKLVSVMCFKILEKNKFDFELVRFATDYNYLLQGIASKLLNFFIKNYKYNSIISFADRRWTLNSDNNLYTKLGFTLIDTLKPDYKYYNTKIDRYKRYHKFGFRKQILSKKYGLDLNMTEVDMVKELGYDRIWDCGLFKYELKNNK